MKKIQTTVTSLLLIISTVLAQGSWLPLGTGLKHIPRTLFADTIENENALYVGGTFESAGGNTACNGII